MNIISINIFTLFYNTTTIYPFTPSRIKNARGKVTFRRWKRSRMGVFKEEMFKVGLV
jgi:hypothetical protein